MGEYVDQETKNAIDAVERKFDALREADREAVKVAHADLSSRLEGFPQQFATKDQIEGAVSALQRLEKDAISREIYETQNKILDELVHKLEREKMDEKAFGAFVDNYRTEQETAATERRAVAAALATRADRDSGRTATWKQIAAVSAASIGIITFLISIVVLLANGAL
jgi:hypothetical protein